MKYPNVNIPEEHRYTCTSLLRDVNRQLVIMHRFAENDFPEDVERTKAEITAYINGYTACMINANAGFRMWFFSRLSHKVTDAYLADTKAMEEKRRARLHNVYNW